jgi:hypothetical protein
MKLCEKLKSHQKGNAFNDSIFSDWMDPDQQVGSKFNNIINRAFSPYFCFLRHLRET